MDRLNEQSAVIGCSLFLPVSGKDAAEELKQREFDNLEDKLKAQRKTKKEEDE